MSHMEWKERRISLQNKITVLKHFMGKCKDAVKLECMKKELERHQKDFQKSSIMENVSEEK